MTIASRLFLALMPPDPVRDACEKAARDLVIKMVPGGRAVPPAKYHLTLIFLGHQLTADQQFAALEAAGQVAADPFDIRLDHAACFPDAHAWWLGQRKMPDGLMPLRAALLDGVHAAGINPERLRFNPHVTVHRSGRKLPPTQIAPIDWRVTDFAMIRSSLLPEMSVYEEIGRWSLKGASKPGNTTDQMSLW